MPYESKYRHWSEYVYVIGQQFGMGGSFFSNFKFFNFPRSYSLSNFPLLHQFLALQNYPSGFERRR